MFCNLCGKPLQEGFKYVVCDPCFAERRQEVIYSGLQRKAMKGPCLRDTTPNIGLSLTVPLQGFNASSAYIGFSAGSGYEADRIRLDEEQPYLHTNETREVCRNGTRPLADLHWREVIPSDDDYIFSARAEEVKKEIEEKKLIRKRMIRIDIEGLG